LITSFDFFFEVYFLFGFFGAFFVCAGSSGKAERPPETRHDSAVFFDRPPAML